MNDLIEKPSEDHAPSNLAVMGRYILTPTIFPILESIERGVGNEIQLTDALRHICKQEGLSAMELKGDRYDIGDKLGYTKAIVEMGLQRSELRTDLLTYFEHLIKKERQREVIQ